jgi:hypothetical protein
MKQAIYLIIVLVTIGLQCRAQDELDSRTELMFGLKAGVNNSKIYDAQGEGFQTRTKSGIAAGAFLAIPLNLFLGIQPELLFSQKGFTGTGKILGSDYQLSRTTNYMDVPLFFALKPSRFISLLAGPQFSCLWRQNDEFTNGITGAVREQSVQNGNPSKNSLGFSGGLDITLEDAVFSLRAAWDVQSNNSDGISSVPRYKNALYQFTFGLRI